MSVSVGGTEEAPTDSLMATLVDVIVRWAEVKQTIAAFARALAPDHHVPLDPPIHGGFAARNCGFDGDLVFQSIDARQRSPDRDQRFRVLADDQKVTLGVASNGKRRCATDRCDRSPL